MKLNNLVGMVFGRLSVIRRFYDTVPAKWECRCDCGNLVVVSARHLHVNGTKSCGCSRKDRADNLVGERHGRLLVVERMPNKGVASKAKAMWRCVCDCGNETVVDGNSLKTGNTKSCGCWKALNGKIMAKDLNRSHGMSKNPIYYIWDSMMQRCRNQHHKSFMNYGGRGIKVCDDWLTFENFYADMGDPPPGKSLDRIDCNGDYSPGNCRWSTQKQQGRNKRTNRLIAFQGQTLTLGAWAERSGIHRVTLSDRLKRGWPMEKAITESSKTYHQKRPSRPSSDSLDRA